MTESRENNQDRENHSENNQENRRDTMRSVVAKLLNLALHPNTPKGEKDAAMDRATQIMAKYNIAQHEAILKDGIDINDTMTEEVMDMFYSYQSQGWEAYLGQYIGKAFDVEIILKKARYSDESDKINFLGNSGDVGNTVYFFDYLQMLISGEARLLFKKISDRNDFGMGAGRKIGERLEELYLKVQAAMPSDCTALVIVKKGAVSTFVKNKYPNMGQTRGKSVRNWGAYDKGKDYGSRVSLGKGIAGNSPSKQIGG